MKNDRFYTKIHPIIQDTLDRIEIFVKDLNKFILEIINQSKLMQRLHQHTTKVFYFSKKQIV